MQTFKVEGLVIGGVAASLLGRPRVTHDVDVLVLVPREKWKDFLESSKNFGFIARIPDALIFAQANRVFLMRHEPSGFDIDVSIGGLPFEEEAISRKIIVETAGVNIPLPTPEDLIIMKAVASRPRDMADIESILEMHSSLNQKYILKKVREFSTALEMPEILRDLKTILKRMRSK
ncbi:MAG: nucleotidyl transferase AbiEii/AbiGii toxin family protein [Thermodesulfobacteriota bacterium]